MSTSYTQPSHLGELWRNYKPGLLGNLQNIVIGLLLLLLGLFLSAIAFTILSNFPAQAETGLIVGTLVLILITFALLGIGGYFLYQAVKESKHQILLYEHGLVNIQGSKSQAAQYKDIAVWQKITSEYLWYVIPVRSTYLYTIQLADGTKIKSRDKRVGELVQERVCNYQIPEAIAAYNAGLDVNFGLITISKQGLKIKQEVFPWSAIEGIRVNKGVISVSQKNGGWFNRVDVEVAEIRNVFVFLTLLQQLGYLVSS